MRRVPARPMRACFVRSCCCVAVPEHDLRATPVQCNVKQTLSSHFTLHSSHPTLHTSHLHFISTHLLWALLISIHVFPYVSQVLLGNFHVNYFPVLMSTTKACTKHFPVLLCTTKLAQTTSQYYFVLQSLHKLLPSTTLYYNACTNYFPVPLCITKLAQTTSQYYFALQSLHKTGSNTTL